MWTPEWKQQTLNKKRAYLDVLINFDIGVNM